MKTEKDSIYSIDCTGDACVGDEVKYTAPIWSGTYPDAILDGYETITGKIIKDSYGEKKQQHTFTIELENGSKKMVKGRNLYRNFCYRKPWEDENERKRIIAEKHERGRKARNQRGLRNQQNY